MEKIFLGLRDVEFKISEELTIGIGTLHPIREGWVVPMRGFQNLIGERGMLIALEVAKKTSKAIAGVKDDEDEFWDVVMIFENEDDATEAAKDHEALFIYQIETGKVVWMI